MNQKGFINILLIIIVVAFVGASIYVVSTRETPSTKPININCTADSQCPANYICEASQSMGTACAMNSSDQPVDLNCVPSTTIIKGSCKVKRGYSCSTSSDCAVGNLCHAGLCTSPVSQVCDYSGDPICGADYKCIQDCGSPVPRGDELPPGWHCIANEQAAQPRMCPICLAGNTFIDTPSGLIPVKNLQVGMLVWTTDKTGQRLSGIVTKTSKVPVPSTHQMVHLVLADGRELFASPGHPTIDGRTVGDLVPGNLYNGAPVMSTERVSYNEGATYDILPSSDTGFYWANGILIGSTLR